MFVLVVSPVASFSLLSFQKKKNYDDDAYDVYDDYDDDKKRKPKSTTFNDSMFYVVIY